MAGESRSGLIFIVAGSSLRAEELDRPLAYYLKQEIETAIEALGTEARELVVRVISDFRWLHEDKLQSRPTISVGGPGVNVLAHQWLEEVPVAMAVDEQYYIQMDPDLDEPYVSIWGMDNAQTQLAVAVFVRRLLPAFLEHCLAMPPEDEDEDEDQEAEE